TAGTTVTEQTRGPTITGGDIIAINDPTAETGPAVTEQPATVEAINVLRGSISTIGDHRPEAQVGADGVQPGKDWAAGGNPILNGAVQRQPQVLDRLEKNLIDRSQGIRPNRRQRLRSARGHPAQH